MSDKRQQTSEGADFLKQGSILAMASLLVRFIGMIYRIPMSNILGEEGNGIYAVAVDVYDIVLIISSYSIPLALSKIIAAQSIQKQYRNTGKTFRLTLIFALVSGGLFGILLFAGSGFIETHIYPDYAGVRYPLRILAPTVFIVALLGGLRGFFQGKKTMIPTAVSQVIEQIVNAIVSVAGAYYLMKWNAESPYKSGWGAAGGTLGTCMGAFFALLLVIFVYWIYRPIQHKLERKDRTQQLYSAKHIYRMLILTILPVILSQTVYQISGLVDYYLFGNILGQKGIESVVIKSMVGMYSSKYRLLTTLPIAISTSIASSMIPSAVAAFTKRDIPLLNYNISSGIKFNMIIAFPCSIGYMVLGQGLIRMLFPSSDYITGGKLMLAGSVAIIFYAISNVTGGALQSIDKMRIPVIHSAISLAIHVGIVMVLLKLTGLNVYVLVIGNVTFPIVVSILNILALKRYIPRFHLNPWMTFGVPLSASLWMGVSVAVVYTIIHRLCLTFMGGYIANALASILSILVGIFVFFWMFLSLKGMTKEELFDFPMGRKLYLFARKLHLME